ncbi:hypothetical protein Dimus_025160 [Dionaea muscipula]
MDNGLSNVMDLIKRQKYEKLFKRRELMHIDAIKEFYARLTLVHFKKKEVARSQVRGVDIEFDNFRLASILGVPGHNGICEYIKDVWDESKYTKPLEIIRKFTITEARRVRSIEIKPFQRFIYFLVMKNVVPRFGKRDTTSYMDLIYMDHIVSRRLVNLPRVMMRHMSYVISVKDHELPYGDRVTMIFEAFGLKRENRVWWLCSGENRRRDDDVQEGESGLGEKFFDAEDEVPRSEEVSEDVPDMPAPAPVQQKKKAPAEVDPSALTRSIPDPIMSKLQAGFERARVNRIQTDLKKAQAENAKLLALLQQAQSQPKP